MHCEIGNAKEPRATNYFSILLDQYWIVLIQRISHKPSVAVPNGRHVALDFYWIKNLPDMEHNVILGKQNKQQRKVDDALSGRLYHRLGGGWHQYLQVRWMTRETSLPLVMPIPWYTLNVKQHTPHIEYCHNNQKVSLVTSKTAVVWVLSFSTSITDRIFQQSGALWRQIWGEIGTNPENLKWRKYAGPIFENCITEVSA